MTNTPTEDTHVTDPNPAGNPPGPPGPLRRRDQPPVRPRWVNVFGIVVIVLIVVFLALHFTGHVPMHR